MHSIIKDINFNIRPKTVGRSSNSSPEKSNLFVPFHQERDNMGRLLKSYTSGKITTQKQQINFDQFINTEQKNSSALQQSKIEEQINLFFKFKNFDNIYQQNKNKVNKKSMINQFLKAKFHKKQEKTYQNKENQPKEQKLKKVRKLKQMKTLNPMFQLGENSRASLFMKRTMSTILPVKKNLNNSPPKQVKQPLAFSKSKPASTTEHFNVESCLYLRKYKRMQQLQIKPFNNFDEDHKGFIQKMNKSRLLARKIKDNINLIDDII